MDNSAGCRDFVTNLDIPLQEGLADAAGDAVALPSGTNAAFNVLSHRHSAADILGQKCSALCVVAGLDVFSVCHVVLVGLSYFEIRHFFSPFKFVFYFAGLKDFSELFLPFFSGFHDGSFALVELALFFVELLRFFLQSIQRCVFRCFELCRHRISPCDDLSFPRLDVVQLHLFDVHSVAPFKSSLISATFSARTRSLRRSSSITPSQ